MAEGLGNSFFFLILGLSGLSILGYFIYKLYLALESLPEANEPERIEIDQPQVRLGPIRNVERANANNPHFRRRRRQEEENNDDEMNNNEQRRVLRAFEKKKRYLEKQKQREKERLKKLELEEKNKKKEAEIEQELRQEYDSMFQKSKISSKKSHLKKFVEFLIKNKTVNLSETLKNLKFEEIQLLEENLKLRLKWMIRTNHINGFFNKDESKFFYLNENDITAIEEYLKKREKVFLTDFKNFIN